jgi:hypothetical protein
MNKSWRAMTRAPWAWAGAFALFDLLWLLGLYAIGWVRTSGSGEFLGTGFDFANSALRMWNTMHYPIRQLLEPVLFPLVNANASVPGPLVFHVFEAICILQSVLIGYILGQVYVRLANKRQQSASTVP